MQMSKKPLQDDRTVAAEGTSRSPPAFAWVPFLEESADSDKQHSS